MARMYADLTLNQRAHYGAYLDMGQHVIASASPELFFQWVGDRLLTRPMKGTAARGRTQAEDQLLVQGLVSSAKERAENVIVVDLLRNDVSRVAEAGSVNVPVLCALERYESVWQLTSDVTGGSLKGPDCSTSSGHCFRRVRSLARPSSEPWRSSAMWRRAPGVC